MNSKFINEANRSGTNYGVFYFIGMFVSLFLGQFLGAIPLLIVMLLNGRLDLESLTNPAAMGIDKNLYFFLMLLPFVISFLLLWLFVKWVHKRPPVTLITPFGKVDWGKLFFGFFVWLGLMTIMEGGNYLIDRENYELQFRFSNFIMLLLISFPMLLIQTAYEEVLFRGYMMQWLGRYMPYRIFPLLLTGIAFGVMHMMNPEVGAFGWQVMIDYISIGIILGLVTILSDSLELAIGLHFANNLFLSLFVTFDDSVLQTDAVFRIKEMELSGTSQIYSIILLLIFFFIVRRKYHFKPVSYLWQYDSWKKNVLDEQAQ